MSGCSHSISEDVLRVEDPVGDVRLKHPAAPGLERGAFDLRSLHIVRDVDRVLVKVTFDAPVRQQSFGDVPESTSPVFLQTVDVYLDTRAGQGDVEALAGRGFHVPAPQAWDRVLVLAHGARPQHEGRMSAQTLYAQGRTLVGVFPSDAVPPGTRGFLAVVAATSTGHDGGIRPVTEQLGDCESWDSLRCTLTGSGPAILDATSPVDSSMLALIYPSGEVPEGTPVPVVFQRGRLLMCAPVPDSILAGALGTVTNEVGTPLGMVVVRSVTDGVASTEWLSEEERTGAQFVAFGGNTQ